MTVRSPKALIKVLDLLLDTVFMVDAEGRIVFVSAACEELLGYTQEDLFGRNFIEFVLPEDRERTLLAGKAIMAGSTHVHFENRYFHRDGSIVDIMWSARWSKSDGLRIAVARNMTALKHAERKQSALYAISEAAHVTENLVALYQQIHLIIANLLPSDLFFAARYNQSTNVVSYPYFCGNLPQNPEAHPLGTDTRLARVIQSGQALLLSEGDAVLGPFTMAGSDSYHQWLGVPLTSQNGTIGALVMARRTGGLAYTDQDADLLQFVSTQIATTIERKQSEVRLQHLASHDPLTDLPNRMLFQDRFEMALKRAHREQEKLALLYLDLDDFKEINDNHGHHVGDLFLCEVAKRLTHSIRETDTVARMGGDEFAVIITNVQGPETAKSMVNKIRKEIQRPCILDEISLSASVSIGIAIYPDEGVNSQELIRYADEHMYHSKRS